MKRFLLLMFFSIAGFCSLNSQNILFENFDNTPIGSMPAGWTNSSNSSVQNYNRPPDCTVDKGVQTPGVGKSAPSRFILPVVNYDQLSGVVTITFTVYVFDANMNCIVPPKDFPCPTYVGAFLVRDTYSGGINSLPAPSDILATQSYQLAIANGSNTIIFNDLNLTDGQPFRVYLDFKTAENSNCTGGGTKFVFDDFSISKSNCQLANNECPPVANIDYFDGGSQQFENFNSVKGNVFGGYALWASDLNNSRPGFNLKSLEDGPNSFSVNDGLDYDNNNHPLADMDFVLVSGPTVEEKSCTGTPGSENGTLVWNEDGSFQYTRANSCVIKVSFQYKIVDPDGNESDVATVIITFVPQIPLPVKFQSFTAVRNKNNVAIKWETSQEINNRGFYVQRNINGSWENIAFVFSQADNGNSNSPLSYSFNDLNTTKGVTQYRIQQVDMDGKARYSDIRSVRGEANINKLLVYPNPTSTGSVNVVFEDQSPKNVTVLDMSGRMVKQYRSVVNNVSVDNLENGVYSIQVTDVSTAAMSVEKVVVKKR